MQKAADAQRRDGETDAMALSRWITETPAGKAAYAEDRHAALTEARKVYRRGSPRWPFAMTMGRGPWVLHFTKLPLSTRRRTRRDSARIA